MVSCPDAVLTSRHKKDSTKSEGENELIEGLTGDKLIKILVSFTFDIMFPFTSRSVMFLTIHFLL